MFRYKQNYKGQVVLVYVFCESIRVIMLVPGAITMVRKNDWPQVSQWGAKKKGFEQKVDFFILEQKVLDLVCVRQTLHCSMIINFLLMSNGFT